MLKRTMKVACFALFAAALALPFASCRRQDDGYVVRIGVYQPLTGANAAGGTLELAGVLLAHEMQPYVYINGTRHEVQLFIEDNRSDRVEAPLVVERLISHHRVHMILGTWGSSMAIPGGEVLRGRIPAIALSATNPMVTLGNPWYFRVCFIDPFQGQVMANFAFNNLGARTAVLVQEITNDYSVGLNSFFADAFRQLTGNPNAILSTLNYSTGDTDFTAQVTQILSLNPDVVFAPGNFTESALVIRQARDLGITTPFLGGDTWETPEFVLVGADRVEGAIFSTKFAAEFAGNPIAVDFVNTYRARNNRDPATVTALGFDGYFVALEAIARAGTLDPHRLRESLEETYFVGATGTTIFNEHGDAEKGAFIKEVVNGQFVFRYFIDP
ncbi:MAG: ABC transporter substrate-binding protein [Treponema sp.]|nr:ABC transporter substrate-binding protein [Treponema sp.]